MWPTFLKSRGVHWMLKAFQHFVFGFRNSNLMNLETYEVHLPLTILLSVKYNYKLTNVESFDLRHIRKIGPCHFKNCFYHCDHEDCLWKLFFVRLCSSSRIGIVWEIYYLAEFPADLIIIFSWSWSGFNLKIISNYNRILNKYTPICK